MSADSALYAVILAGGSGTRFWPASRRLRPKQLLPLGPAAPNSLIQATVSRLEGLVEPGQVLISTGAHLVDATRAQLSQLAEDAFLAEPLAKNTAPCIAWAASVIARKDPQAVVCVLPSDQYAENAQGFRETLSRAAAVAATGSITTVGIVPSRPETGYGYIHRGKERSDDGYGVLGFKEKPDRSTAETYCKSGDYFWNAGIFVFRASDMLRAVELHMPQLYAQLQELERATAAGGAEATGAVSKFFESCESQSIDYGVMEKEENLSVVPGDFGWSDLGSWESAWELSPKDESGNSSPQGTIFVDARNNLVEDSGTDAQVQKKVIALVGVSDLCVVQTDDALLVMPRERSQDVRKVVDALKKAERKDLV